MPDVADTGGGGGGSSSISAATPDTLHLAGLTFRTQSNTCYGISSDADVQAGGDYEIAAVDCLSEAMDVPGDFPDAMRSFMSTFFGMVVSAQQQLADAAVDLMQCAGDFKAADQTLPSNMTQPEPARGPGGEPMPGITMRMDAQGNWYYTDKAGDVYKQTQGEYEVQMGQASPLGQTYTPPAGQRP